MSTIQIVLIVVVGLAVIAVGYILLRLRKADLRQKVCLLGNNTVHKHNLPRIRNIAKHNRDSYFLDADAYRRRASGNHEIIQVSFENSAVPAYPGTAADVRSKKVEAHKNQLTALAEMNADYDLEESERSELRDKQYSLYKLIGASSAVVILVIAILVLVMSGKLHSPF